MLISLFCFSFSSGLRPNFVEQTSSDPPEQQKLSETKSWHQQSVWSKSLCRSCLLR